MPTASRIHRSTESLAGLTDSAKSHEKPSVRNRPSCRCRVCQAWPEPVPIGPDVSELAEFDALDDAYPWPVWGRGAP